MRRSTCCLWILTLALPALSVFGQGKKYEGPDDPAGDVAAIREGYMNGNRVYMYFQNQCELSDWPREDASKWPNDYSGGKMTDGINPLITAQVFLKNDTIPVTDPAEIASRADLDTLWFCQTHFRGGLDTDSTGTIEWALYPVFGYFNNDKSNEYPAMSNIPNSWPPDGWPSRGDQKKWPGVWNGRFGLGVAYADLETYFVDNDAQDQEYLQKTSTVRYSPRPGFSIGYKDPNVTIQKGRPWGGLGVRVEVRGYQWNNPLVRDAIFFEYNIANISDYDLPQMAFGFHLDNGIGNDSNDEMGFYNTYVDMAYSWDVDGVGSGGRPTGSMGFAYLESPGLGYDGVDNDEDGLLDEKRDNAATQIVGPSEGIANMDAYLKFYGLQPAQLKAHWDADEDQDWQDGQDADNNGRYDVTENAGDDVGLDGIGPGELQYPGPDEGECNHRPDYREGIGCEPNFNATDVDESDMLGLTSFNIFPVTEQLNGQPRTFSSDWVMWQLTGTSRVEIWTGGVSNLIEVFGSGPFPLYKGRTERFSMANLYAYEDLSGLRSTDHKAPVLFELKKVVQMIYQKDYRFAQPPKTPTLTATAGDGEVALTWDDIADTRSREPFLGNKNDFEGYKLIRATDMKFQDAQVVTDGNGMPLYYKPLFQCDKIDNIKGYTNFGLRNGTGYYLGNDTGIQHYFVDKTVQNGKTYYYGLIAYDYGISDTLMPPGIAPSESNLVVDIDEYENIRQLGKNVQVVTPHQTALGYAPPALQILDSNIKETSGSVVPQIVSKNALKPDHTYRVHFVVDTVYWIKGEPTTLQYTAAGYRIVDLTDSGKVVAYEDKSRYLASNIVNENISLDEAVTNKKYLFPLSTPIYSDAADGVSLAIQSNVITSQHGGYDYGHSGWKIGNAGVDFRPSTFALRFYPWDYELVFTGNPRAYKGKAIKGSSMTNENGTTVSKDSLIVGLPVSFFMINKNFPAGAGFDTLDVAIWDFNKNGQFDLVGDKVLFGSLNDKGRWLYTAFVAQFREEPQPGDVYFSTGFRPFCFTDSMSFKVLPQGDLNKEDIAAQMSKIKVVPNPYVATNGMEPVVGNWYLNQRRRLLFTHLPARCSIKIFTVSGVLVAEFEVENEASDGTAHWDLLTSEGLEVAAGMYLYHVKAKETNAEKIGKFAVIK
jgi:hypothetical protein